ncbi:MAG: tRNA preQ1(34) S-adenosylmethionine ribosyltransferase-isomerase QueA [Oscillibacter sp.]|nr:tRNA preQ1(34) S-adenosylmethionine ribosyltransferase-isomerase QueA [Oscillibacter sp.]
MKLSKFKFKLPTELIALHPAENRDECRLMVLNKKTGQIEHKVFKDILDYFDENDVFVFNDTKVFPARLYGNKEKTGAEIEVFLLRELNRDLRIWDVLVDPARKIRIGNKLYFGEDDSLVAEVIDNTTSRGRTLRFLFDGEYDEFKKILYGLGETPLPKSIERKVEPEDAERYQTIFAKNEGAVAAPTAGLHFSRELMKRLEIKGVNFAFLTLHVGLGNFREVDVEDLTKHKMDSEQIFVGPEVVQYVNEAKDEKRKVCAVGTTVVRTLESCVTTKGRLTAFEGWTNKFIFPPYDFSVPDAFISNFHLPFSTLLMMVAAFGGYDQVMKAYDVAVKEKYKFGAYGDAMLII